MLSLVVYNIQMENLIESQEAKDFFVWIDPKYFLIVNNLINLKTLFSMPGDTADNLMFVPNPAFQGFISPFQANLLWNYKAEYNLELHRRQYFDIYPSRMTSLFLFESDSEAIKYSKHNPEIALRRELKHLTTHGSYRFSRHDLSWVDFLRLPHGALDDTLYPVCDSYWRGIKVEECTLSSCRQSWTQSPIIEILYEGTVKLLE